MDASESVHLNVSCYCKTCGSFQTDNAGVLELTERHRHLPSLGETLHCRTPSKNSPKRHRAKRKTINCQNLKSSDMATLETCWLPKSPPKPAFSLDCTKCGHQTWFIYEQLMHQSIETLAPRPPGLARGLTRL